jgi:hypothetical protein
MNAVTMWDSGRGPSRSDGNSLVLLNRPAVGRCKGGFSELSTGQAMNRLCVYRIYKDKRDQAGVSCHGDE